MKYIVVCQAMQVYNILMSMGAPYKGHSISDPEWVEWKTKTKICEGGGVFEKVLGVRRSKNMGGGGGKISHSAPSVFKME